VYVAVDEAALADRLALLPDVSRLAADETVSFEATLPGRGAFPRRPESTPSTPARVGLGDAIGWVTSRLGIRECGPCGQRKMRLNRVSLSSPRRRPIPRHPGDLRP